MTTPTRCAQVLGALSFLHLPGSAKYLPEERIQSARLYGSIDPHEYYYVDMMVGTPPQRTNVIVDTGSGITGYPCKKCSQCGPNHVDVGFDVNASSTAKWIKCGSPNCHGSCEQDHCSYYQGYFEGSKMSGWWFTDKVQLDDLHAGNPAATIDMGCHMMENHMFYTQQANGIMGLRPPGQGRRTFLDQLFENTSHVNVHIFTLCFADWGGRMHVGGYNKSMHLGPLQWIPMATSSSFFHVSLSEMKIGGKSVGTSFSSTMIDSGTTFSYFSDEVYAAILAAIDGYCAEHGYCNAIKSGRECYMVKERNISAFPDMELIFSSVKTKWPPKAYLYYKHSATTYCYAFLNQGSMSDTMLGASWVKWKDVVFDMQNRKVGVAPAECHSFKHRPLDNRLPLLTAVAQEIDEWTGAFVDHTPIDWWWWTVVCGTACTTFIVVFLCWPAIETCTDYVCDWLESWWKRMRSGHRKQQRRKGGPSESRARLMDNDYEGMDGVELQTIAKRWEADPDTFVTCAPPQNLPDEI